MTRRTMVLALGFCLFIGGIALGQGNSTKPATRPIAPQRLAGMLKGRSVEVRAEALALLNSEVVQQPLVADAIKDSVDRDLRTKQISALTARSLQRLGQSEREEDVQFLIKLTKHSDIQVAVASTLALADHQNPEHLPHVLSLADRKEFGQHFGLRRAVVDSVAAVPDRTSVEFLIDILKKYDGELRYQTAEHLSRLTGQSFGGHADQWSTWWKDQGDESVLSRRGATTGVVEDDLDSNVDVKRLSWPEPLPEFFGMPIYAKRVVFVIDRSKSMRSSVDGITRLEEAVKELEKAVDALDRYAYFNVFAYNTDVLPFMSRLVQAEDANKQAARNFAYRLKPDLKTACYDALYAGLMADPNLEALYFLSDGEPTAGRIVDMPTIVNSITAQNAQQRTSIYTLGIDARGEHERFLRELARRNDGRFRMVR